MGHIRDTTTWRVLVAPPSDPHTPGGTTRRSDTKHEDSRSAVKPTDAATQEDDSMEEILTSGFSQHTIVPKLTRLHLQYFGSFGSSSSSSSISSVSSTGATFLFSLSSLRAPFFPPGALFRLPTLTAAPPSPAFVTIPGTGLLDRRPAAVVTPPPWLSFRVWPPADAGLLTPVPSPGVPLFRRKPSLSGADSPEPGPMEARREAGREVIRVGGADRGGSRDLSFALAFDPGGLRMREGRR